MNRDGQAANGTIAAQSRDLELGAELARLEIMDHGEGYWPTVLGATADEMGRVWARRRRLRLATVAAAAAAAIVLGVALIGLPGGETGNAPLTAGPQTASAAQRMLTAMDIGMSSTDSIRADVTYSRQYAPPGGRDNLQVWQGAIITTSNGSTRVDLRLAQHAGGTFGTRSLTLYDARSHTLLRAFWGDDSPRGTEYKGSWPTSRMDEGPASSWQLYTAEAAFAEALLAEDSRVFVGDGSYQGRPAWTATMTASSLSALDTMSFGSASPSSSAPAATLTFIVDKQTGLLLRSVFDAPGSYREEIALSDVSTHVYVPPGLFDQPPKGVSVEVAASEWESEGQTIRVESFNHFASLDAAAARAGFDPLLPRSTPEGYRLTDVASSPLMRGEAGGWLPESTRTGVQPPTSPTAADGEIQLLYRRGFEWFQILQADLAASDAVFSQPGWQTSGSLRHLLELVRRYPFAETTKLTGGTLRGAPTVTWISFSTGPGLAVVGDGYALMITGSMTRSELLSLANSLTPYSH